MLHESLVHYKSFNIGSSVNNIVRSICVKYCYAYKLCWYLLILESTYLYIYNLFHMELGLMSFSAAWCDTHVLENCFTKLII